MRNQMINKVKLFKVIDVTICAILSVLLLSLVVAVLFVRGIVGATAWSLAVLFISPAAVVLSVICIIRLIVAIIRKKKVLTKLYTLVILLFLSYPLFILLGISNITYPGTGKEKPSISIELPFQDTEDLVILGGKDYKIHAIWPSECYAYDIMKHSYDIISDSLEDYGIFGEEIISPVDGKVIAAFDEEIDIGTNQDEFLSLAGNHVYIKIEETGTYLMFAHLMQNSVRVQVGDYVKAGDVIGKVGNSGTSSEPHLHLQHQRQNPLKVLHFTFAEGLPLQLINTK